MMSGMTNIAYASGTSTGGNIVTSQDDAVLDVALQNPSIRIIKTANIANVPLGSSGIFSIAVTNNGDSALTGVVVTDPLVSTCSRIIGALSIGQTVTYTCTLDVVNTGITNTAYVT